MLQINTESIRRKHGITPGWVACILAVASGLTGCTTHRIQTTHEVEPIHITVDVNLKIDRALDDYFDEIDEAAETNTPAPTAAEEG